MELSELIREIEQAYKRQEEPAEILKLYGQIEDPNALYLEIPPLFKAAEYADAGAIELLLEKGADPTFRKESLQRGALHYLAEGAQNLRGGYNHADIARSTRLLLDAGASPLRKDADSRTCAVLAADRANYKMLAALAEAGKKLDMTDSRGNTPLHIASDRATRAAESFYKYTKPKYDEFLAQPEPENEIEKTIQASRGRTVLEQYEQDMAELENYFQTVKVLLEAGLDPDQKNDRGESAKSIAFTCQELRIPAILNGELPEDGALDGDAMLRMRTKGMNAMQAVLKKEYDALDAVLELEGDPNRQYEAGETVSGLGSTTPLGVACALLDVQSIQTLLRRGADPSYRDSSGRIAAAYAFTTTASVNTGHNTFENKVVEQMLEGMKEKGLDVNMVADDRGNTLLLLAAAYLDGASGYNSDTLPGKFLSVLLRMKADPNARNHDGVTPLMPVCLGRSDRMEDAQLSLLEQGAEVFAQDSQGNTPLICAAQNRNFPLSKTLAEMLYEFGDPNPAAMNNEGKTAMDYAAENGNELLVNYLLQKM